MLMGPEVKSLRLGRGSVAEAFAGERDGELWLFNCFIPKYEAANHFNIEPRRARKLLLHRRQADRLLGAVQREGMTLVPLEIYFNERGLAKVLLGLARGKHKHDKREAEKTRDWGRERARLMREKG